MNTEKRNKLSVIMPALNEEHNILGAIKDTLEAFEIFGIIGEIIVINDGSADRTQAIAEEKAREHPEKIVILKHLKPQGLGASFWEGVDAATGNFIVMLPGDNENDPQEILRYYKLLEHVDIVIPFLFNREVRSIFRNALSYLFRFIINTTFFVNFNYTNGTILYRKSILKESNVYSSGFFFQTDILIRLVKKGYLFAEVPYRVRVRNKGVSKAVSFPSFFQVVRGYLRLLKDFSLRKEKFDSTSKFHSDSQTAARRKNF
ncbi:MAG: glycosyltransferase family 2 protein [Candidatus Omnitrophota bacterium]